MTRRARRLGGSLAALVAVAALAPRAALAGGDSSPPETIERELEASTKTTGVATVFCLPKGVTGGQESGSSGVLVTRTGYVLSDSDVGAFFVPKPGQGPDAIEKHFTDTVEVRVPDAKRPYIAYAAKVVARVREIDSCLLKITNPPSSGFTFLSPRTAQDLRVGDYAFAFGTPFGHDESGAAAQTLGIVSALVRAPETAVGGRWSEVYVSAAVNPGVNGGPVVDADGSLVGIVSTWGDSSPKNPFQFLSKVYPIDRVRAAYRDRPEAEEVFKDAKAPATRSKQAHLLETAYALAGERAFRSVVSLEIDRAAPLDMTVDMGRDGKPLVLARYGGPVSALAVSRDGWVVTSLYNVANVTKLGKNQVTGALERDVADVKGATLWLQDGTSAPAKLVAHDQRLAVALFKADLPAGKELVPVDPAPAASAQVGRTVLCVGNPFGAGKPTSPLLTAGIYSRYHPCDCGDPWRDSFQTDAGVTDGNVGGALVDVHGRVLGMAHLWDPAMQGRSSGIGFGVPITRILAALPSLQCGTCVKLGWIGVVFEQDPTETRGVLASTVSADGPAAKGGMKNGDIVAEIDGKKVAKFEDAVRLLHEHVLGDSVKITVLRAGERKELVVTLGEPPPPDSPR